MNDPAYVLFWDTSLVGDEGVSAELVPFPGSENVAGWLRPNRIEVPDRIYFEANIDTVRQVDYPDNSVNWPLMSERMRAIALRNAPEHRVIPVVMLDDTVPTTQRFDGDRPRPGVAIEGFAAIQLLELTDAMDMERSVYIPDEDFPERARDIKKLVLKEMPLPSLFRLSAYRSPLMISREARVELEAAGIKGVQYWPLERAAGM